MAVKVRFVGVDKVLRNLNAEIKKIEGRTQAGVIDAAMMIKNKAGHKTPRDTGNLVGSAYVIWPKGKQPNSPNFKGEDTEKLSSDFDRGVSEGKSRMNRQKQPVAEIGYTAYYAVFVHEIDKAYRGGKSWKLLESALTENAGKIMILIKAWARIK